MIGDAAYHLFYSKYDAFSQKLIGFKKRIVAFYELYRIKFFVKYTHFLLKWNGIETTKNAPIGFMLNTLTPEAFKLIPKSSQPHAHRQQGLAQLDLYLINKPINLGFFKFNFKIRGLTLFSVVSGKNKLKDFANLPDRTTFATPRQAMESMIFPAQQWTRDLAKVKVGVKKKFVTNQRDLWLYAREYCQAMPDKADYTKSPAYNYALMTFNIFSSMMEAPYFPPEFIAWLEKFEQQWLNFNDAQFSSLDNLLKEFELLLKDIDANNVHQHDEMISMLPILGNMPRLIVQLAHRVFSNENFFDLLSDEINRLKHVLKEKNLDIYSSDRDTVDKAFEYILTHSELIQRFYFECLRVAPVVPTMFRINAHLFSNGSEDWGLGSHAHLPPRSLAILPQMCIAMHPDNYDSPEQFNPFRKEYSFRKLKDGVIKSSDAPLSFAPSSKRTCPGQFFMQKLFYAVLVYSIDTGRVLKSDERMNELMDYHFDHFTLLDSHPKMTTQFQKLKPKKEIAPNATKPLIPSTHVCKI